ncbi:MAG: RdgB/HAM1 family non-canonical purine NTP pyrophosphatase [Demequinaceae bacterium]|nr:RdgB/HAM1 family non-canonical purine NTP pyrophosphatase [Demequinaceae bacterium]
MTVPFDARLAFATHNAHKAGEVRAILVAALPGFRAEHLVTSGEVDAPEPCEDGVSFEENALIKARALAAGTGLVAIADDSGITVDVMGGAPGIFSARWAGHHGDDAANLDLLLAQLADVRPNNRGAAFVCAAAAVHPDGREIVKVARLRGVIVGAPRGDNGFGYDPIFVADGQTVTNGELDPETKNAISHRGQAFRALAEDLPRLLDRP